MLSAFAVAAAGSLVLLILSIWMTRKTSAEQCDAPYRRLMLANSYLMCYGFFVASTENALTTVRGVLGDDIDLRSLLGVYVSDLPSVDYVSFVASSYLLIIHHASNLIRVQYEMKRDHGLFERYLLMIALLLAVSYTLLMVFTPMVVFFLVFAHVDFLSHVVHIVLYCRLRYAVMKRGDVSKKHDIELQVEQEMNEAPTTFCCTPTYAGRYASDDCLVRRYWIAIVASVLHNISGLIMISSRTFIVNPENIILRYNLDIITGYIFATLSLIWWRRLIVSTPHSFTRKSRRVVTPQFPPSCNAFTYLYYVCWVTFSVTAILSALFFYLHIANRQPSMELSFVHIAYLCKCAASCILLLLLLYVLPVTRFGDATRWYYHRSLAKLNRYVAFHQQHYVDFITRTTMYFALCFLAETLFAHHVSANYGDSLPLFLCEMTQILTMTYILFYRLFQGSAYFVQIDHRQWNSFLSGWKPLSEPVAKLAPDTKLTICCRRRSACCNFCLKCFNVLNLVLLLLLVLLFNLFLWLAITLASIYVVVRIYICGAVWCTQSTYRAQLNIKRYGRFFDYILFHVLFSCHLDKVIIVFMENEPTKYFVTNLAIIFFQTRYSWFVGSSIPSYNLEYDYIAYPTLYNFGHNTYSRILPSATDEYMKRLPPAEKVKELFLRPKDGFQREDKLNLSLLFGFYVRWFTHQFCNTNPEKPKTTNSPIGMNLCQLYGSTPEWMHKVRRFKGGLLKASKYHGKEFPTVNQHGFFVSEAIPKPAHHDNDFFCIQILFFRHHQYLARSLQQAYPEFDDERLFQTAKLCNILTCIKCTISLYAELGLVQTNLSGKFDVTDLENMYNTWMYKWFGPSGKVFPQNSANVFIEFNVMYRWHQLVPPEIQLVDVGPYLKDKSQKPKQIAAEETWNQLSSRSPSPTHKESTQHKSSWPTPPKSSWPTPPTFPSMPWPTPPLKSMNGSASKSGFGSPDSPDFGPMAGSRVQMQRLPSRTATMMSKHRSVTDSPELAGKGEDTGHAVFRLDGNVNNSRAPPIVCRQESVESADRSGKTTPTRTYSRYSPASSFKGIQGPNPFKLDLCAIRHKSFSEMNMSQLEQKMGNDDDDNEKDEDEDQDLDDDEQQPRDPEADLDETLSRLRLPFLSATRCLLMKKHGLERFMVSASNTAVGKLTLFNTDPFLARVATLPTIEKTRLYKMRSFNDYRERLGFPRYENFEEFSDDEEIAIRLQQVYKSVDDVEFYVGIFAEQKLGRALHGPTLTAIFASFVMSFVSSSLLFRKPWDKMLTPLGKQIVNNTEHVRDLIRLHTDLDVEKLSFRVDEDAR